jgi:hypothetical protein
VSREVPPERDRPFEVPFREVEHEPPPEPDAPAQKDHWPGFLGHAKLDVWWPAPTKAEETEWRRELEEAARRRVRLGFRAEPLP